MSTVRIESHWQKWVAWIFWLRFERAAAPGSNLGAADTDSSPAVLFQLQASFGHGRNHRLELLASFGPAVLRRFRDDAQIPS